MTCDLCKDDQFPAELVGEKLVCIECAKKATASTILAQVYLLDASERLNALRKSAKKYGSTLRVAGKIKMGPLETTEILKKLSEKCKADCADIDAIQNSIQTAFDILLKHRHK